MKNKYIFEGEKSLESIKVAKGIEIIPFGAFENYSLVEKIFLPKSVNYIGCFAFDKCCNLKEIIVDKMNKKYISIDGVLFSFDTKELYRYPMGREDEIVTILSGVETICSQSFYENKNIIEINIPLTVKKIGRKAFFGCDNLERINFFGNENDWKKITKEYGWAEDTKVKEINFIY